MNVLSKIILVLIIVVPIIICITTVNKVWNEDENVDNINSESLNSANTSGDSNMTIEDVTNEIETITAVMDGQTYESKIGEPISKLIEATVGVSVANVYVEADENSEIAGTFEKYTIITAHKYPQGWTRVTNGTISGWMRTDNITFPEGNNTLNVGNSPVGKVGKIKADPYLNVRASANSSASVITTIPNGTEVTIKDESNGWYKVTYASATGWVSATYVTIEQ